MKKMFHFLPIVVFLLMIGGLGCGAGLSKSTGRGMIETVDPFQYGDEFDFVATGRGVQNQSSPVSATVPSSPDGVKPKIVKTPVSTSVRSTADTSFAQQPAVRDQIVEGTVFRAQIGVFEDQRSAEKLAQDARGKVDEKVYVEFEPPFYRVRVGDFKTRKEAEIFVKTLQELGFRGSFWVMKRTAVR